MRARARCIGEVFSVGRSALREIRDCFADLSRLVASEEDDEMLESCESVFCRELSTEDMTVMSGGAEYALESGSELDGNLSPAFACPRRSGKSLSKGCGRITSC